MVRRVLLLHLDGSLPNLALMRIAAHHRQQGHGVELRIANRPDAVERGLYDVPYHRVYASLIFSKSRHLAERLRHVYPNAIIGGSGWDKKVKLTDAGVPADTPPDYADYPAFRHSIGFTQRGCRLACSFCMVSEMEGKVSVVGPVASVWRGDPHPRNVILLDNDFFGNPEWRDRIAEIRSERFRVCFCQGINARFLNDESAEAIASVPYHDSDFRRKRLYTAWDNREDESTLFRGLECLKRAGVPPGNVMVYVLVGYDHDAKQGRGFITDDDVYRVMRLREWGADPYPMPFVRSRETIGFQRWLARFACKRGVSWDEYKRLGCRSEGAADRGPSLFDEVTA